MNILKYTQFINEDLDKVVMTPELKIVEDQMNQSQLAMKTAEERFNKKEIKEPDMLRLKGAEMKKIADLMIKKADILQKEMTKKTA